MSEIVLSFQGRISKAPVAKFTPNGSKVVTLNVATNVYAGKNKEGETNYAPVFAQVELWQERMQTLVLEHGRVGRSVFIVGKMRPLKAWFNQDGQPTTVLSLTAYDLQFTHAGDGKMEEPGEEGVDVEEEGEPEGEGEPS